jgi:hypothetical protein
MRFADAKPAAITTALEAWFNQQLHTTT